MARYIDGDLLIKEFKLLKCENKGNLKRDRIYERTVDQVLNELCSQIVEKQPIADVQPVVHGKWIDINNCGIKERKCSNCGKKDNPKTAIKGHYCWNCGAKMEVQPCQPQKA